MDKTPIKFELVPTNPSNPFSEFLEPTDSMEIPTDYINFVEIEYNNGIIVILAGEDIHKPLPVMKGKKRRSDFSKVRRVSVYINVDKLEYDVNFWLKDLFSGISFQ